jgi:hypothetical protein
VSPATALLLKVPSSRKIQIVSVKQEDLDLKELTSLKLENLNLAGRFRRAFATDGPTPSSMGRIGHERSDGLNYFLIYFKPM